MVLGLPIHMLLGSGLFNDQSCKRAARDGYQNPALGGPDYRPTALVSARPGPRTRTIRASAASHTCHRDT